MVQTEISVLVRPQRGLPKMVGVLNGLVCLAGIPCFSVCIYNVGTREVTPWFTSVIHQLGDEEIEEEDDRGVCQTYIVSYKCRQNSFGYDPKAKRHKVVHFAHKSKTIRGDAWGGFDSVLCEVMTLEDSNTMSSWRRLDELSVPQEVSFLSLSRDYLYVSGSIFWLNPSGGNGSTFILKFDVGSEIFTRISLPDYIHGIVQNSGSLLVELDGHLAIIATLENPHG